MIILLFFVTLNFKIYAQELIADKPDQTESPQTIPAKSFQIECGFLHGHDKNHTPERQLLTLTALLRYGLAGSIELRIVEDLGNYKNEQTLKRTFCLSDLKIGVKIQILRNSTINTEIALLSHLIIPAGSAN